nr:hypothetical protein [uncultured Cohaesibacter sp.]
MAKKASIRAMSAQAKKVSTTDLLEKEYHEIGIQSVKSACCVKKHVEEKHTDYDPVCEKK